MISGRKSGKREEKEGKKSKKGKRRKKAAKTRKEEKKSNIKRKCVLYYILVYCRLSVLKEGIPKGSLCLRKECAKG